VLGCDILMARDSRRVAGTGFYSRRACEITINIANVFAGVVLDIVRVCMQPRADDDGCCKARLSTHPKRKLSTQILLNLYGKNMRLKICMYELTLRKQITLPSSRMQHLFIHVQLMKRQSSERI
jgi:hypothetical protein